MAFEIGKYFLLCAFVALSLNGYTEATVTVTSNFDNYLNVLNKLVNINEQLTVLRAVWGEIRADDPENMHKTKTFYDNLVQVTKKAISAEAEEAAELISEVRNILVIGNGRLLAETLNNNFTQNIGPVVQFRTNLLNTYNEELLDAIFENAIDTVYIFTSTDQLHAELESIDTRLSTLAAFQTNVHWNLYLYYKFLQRGDINDQYLYAAARSLHNIQLHTYYKFLPQDTVRHVSAALSRLPKSLNVLFSSATICLSNANFPNFYLYFKEPSTTNWVYVQAVVSNSNLQHSAWTNSFANSAVTNTTAIMLRTQSKGYYLSRRTTENVVSIEKSDPISTTRTWLPSFREDKIFFSQSNFYMCSTSTYDGTSMGFLVKSVSAISFDDPKCQWIVTDCSELRRI